MLLILAGMKRIETLHLFPELLEGLSAVLENIEKSDWDRPSPIEGRTVKDLVSHLIDGSLRRISMQRDGHYDPSGNSSINSYDELVRMIQELNTEWMTATRRLSPEILIDLLEYSENRLYELFSTLDPDAEAFFPVAWAGDTRSSNWFDIAREYTEKWHHQMQIRMALDRPLLMDRKFSLPLYDTFFLALPHHYRECNDIEIGSGIQVTLSGSLRKSWFLRKKEAGWSLEEQDPGQIISKVEMPSEDAWKIFTNTGRDKEKYLSIMKIEGNRALGIRMLELVTVMS